MRTARNSSVARPSVRAKLIVSPNLHGLQNGRDASQESLRDARESFRRVRHVKVVQILAQFSFSRYFLCDARQTIFVEDRFNRARGRFSRVYEANTFTDHFTDHIPQNRIMSAAQHQSAETDISEIS